MKPFATALLIGLAAAVPHVFTSNGVEYSVIMTKNGVEVPVTLGPDLGMNSTSPAAQAVRRAKRNNIQNTGNWCGVSNTQPPSGTWANVWGGWNVPQVSLRSGQSAPDQPSIAQWVGIDGDGCNTGLIQGGTVSQINSNGQQENYAWWEFVPDALQSVSMTINTGDLIYGNVTVTSATSGIVEVINYSIGLAIIVTINTGPGTLCGQSAEWVLEDLACCGGLVPFAEFPNNEFYNPVSTTTTGEQVVPANADYVYIIQGQTLCEGSYDSSSGNIDILSTA